MNIIFKLGFIAVCMSIIGSMSAQQITSFSTTSNRSNLMHFTENDGEFRLERNHQRNYIVVDPRQEYQDIDGFGFALTGGSAQHIINMSADHRACLLHELFDPTEGIGISTIRLTLGASDLNSFVFSYDDMPKGKEDFSLSNFSLAQDLVDVIPVMKEILKINANIHIISSPWSAPAWMKTNGDSHGGTLRKECYEVYADYFVKYVEEMAKHGIKIDAITIQNESLNSGNTPSMPWNPDEQAKFVSDFLGPKFEKAGLNTQIIIFDHNCDRSDFPLTILNDSQAAKYVAGSAFHHYRGDLSAMSYVHEVRPDKNIYFTEQMTIERPDSESIDIASAANRLIIDVTRNWSRDVILWNLAANSLNEPHTDNGGCTMCQGAVTIDDDSVKRNIAYYVIAHASKCVRPGSKRIFSTAPWERSFALCEDEQHPSVFRMNVVERSDVMPNVAFKTPQGKIVLIVANNSWNNNKVYIQYKGRFAEMSIIPGSVKTFVWNE